MSSVTVSSLTWHFQRNLGATERVRIPNNFSPWAIQVRELQIWLFVVIVSHFGKACLLGAIQAVAKNLGKAEMAKRATVRTSVHIGSPTDLPGFGLAVDIKVDGVDKELLEAGHKVKSHKLIYSFTNMH